MIDADAPRTWQELQERVARILRECGVATEVEKTIETARGKVTVDVWAHDAGATPAQTYHVECKKWRSRVTQNVVHGFRSEVGDAGANWGAIVSSNGFQKGAYEAAKYTNVRLLTWDEFQSLFAERWFLNHFIPAVSGACDALLEYTEPINSRIQRKASDLTEEKKQELRQLRETYEPLGALCLMIKAQDIGAWQIVMGPAAPSTMPTLPLRSTLESHLAKQGMSIPSEILDATSYRSLLEHILREVEVATAAFDAVFGERA
jgi:restriction system protein